MNIMLMSGQGIGLVIFVILVVLLGTWLSYKFSGAPPSNGGNTENRLIQDLLWHKAILSIGQSKFSFNERECRFVWRQKEYLATLLDSGAMRISVYPKIATTNTKLYQISYLDYEIVQRGDDIMVRKGTNTKRSNTYIGILQIKDLSSVAAESGFEPHEGDEKIQSICNQILALPKEILIVFS